MNELERTFPTGSLIDELSYDLQLNRLYITRRKGEVAICLPLSRAVREDDSLKVESSDPAIFLYARFEKLFGGGWKVDAFIC